jgi:hypothetical protein
VQADGAPNDTRMTASFIRGEGATRGTQRESKSRVAVVTPSFARDFELCRELNASVMRHTPFNHYLFVDRSDVPMFRALANSRTIVGAIEDMIPSAFFKVPWLKRHWMSKVSLPVKGWLVQQVVKISSASVVEEPTIVNMDSDTQFVRDVTEELFHRDGETRLYRLPDGITPGMIHVKMHRNVSRLLGIRSGDPPTDDYVGNVISWDREIVLAMCAYIERTTGRPWYVGFARARMVSEYFTYGLYVDKVVGIEKLPLYHDERAWCHTYWGPQPLPASDVESFVAALPPDDVAFSIEGYTGTDPEVARAAVELVKRKIARHEAERGALRS